MDNTPPHFLSNSLDKHLFVEWLISVENSVKNIHHWPTRETLKNGGLMYAGWDPDQPVDLDVHSGIFLGLIWDLIPASSQFKNEQKPSKTVYIIPNFLVLYFSENFMKIKKK